MCSHVCSVNADIPDLKYGDIVHFREGDYMYAFIVGESRLVPSPQLLWSNFPRITNKIKDSLTFCSHVMNYIRAWDRATQETS